jgi:glycopeptide antibiotics resistance protein
MISYTKVTAKGDKMKEKLIKFREKYLPYEERTLRRLAITASIMFAWILIWALVLKLGNEMLLIRNYTNLKDMTIEERILWDLIPFNYRGEGEYKLNLIMDTVLNCFVFAPFGVLFCYSFKKQNVLRDAAICLGFSVVIELTQLATTLGNPATEDLITNTVGCFIGFGLYHLIFKRLSLKNATRLAAVANVIFGIISIFGIVTTFMASETIWGIITRTI